MTSDDMQKAWKAASDHLIAAREHHASMKGKPGEVMAKHDLDKAQEAYDKATAARLAAEPENGSKAG